MTHPSEFTKNGLRAMTAEEGDALTVGDSVRILDSSLGVHHYGHVIGCRRDSVKVRFLISGAILAFDLDDPDLWPERELRDRRPPQATEDETLFVLVTDKAFQPTQNSSRNIAHWMPTAECLPPAPDVFNAVKASVELNTVLAKYAALEERLARVESLLTLKVEA